jgi:hypothetical protein
VRYNPAEMPADATDAARCPLCGGPNACELAAAAAEARPAGRCWCADERIAPELLARIPAQARGRQCVCRRCARAPATDAP